MCNIDSYLRVSDVCDLYETMFADDPTVLDAAIEREMPVVDVCGRGVNWDRFIEPLSGMLSVSDCSGVPHLSCDSGIFVPDASMKVLEFASVPFDNLYGLLSCMQAAIRPVAQLLATDNVYLLCMGGHPISKLTDFEWIDHARYRTLFGGLAMRRVSGQFDEIMRTSVEQVHVKVNRTTVIPATNVFNRLTGLIISLHANDPIREGKATGTMAERQLAWNQYPSDHIGFLPEFIDMEQWVGFLLDRQLFCKSSRQGFETTIGSALDHLKECDISSLDLLIQDIESQVWYDVRPRSKYSTLEIRMACPGLSDQITLAALSTGLVANLDDAITFCATYDHEIWRQAREQAIRCGLNWCGNDQVLFRRSLFDLNCEMLQIATKGLVSRGLHEEHLLGPLIERNVSRRTLADEALELLDEGMETLVNTRCWPVE